jgi:small subunit ribosomal protein S27Ae
MGGSKRKRRMAEDRDGPNPNGKWAKYSLEDGKLVRKGEFCPKCKDGVFMAIHSDRKSCGRCGYTVPNEVSE